MTFSVLSRGTSLCVPQLFRAHNNSDSSRPYRHEDFFFGKATTTVTTSGNNNISSSIISIIGMQQQCFCKAEYQTNPDNRRVYIDFYCKILYNIYVRERLEKVLYDYVLRDIHFTFRDTIAKGIKAVLFRGSTERARSGSRQ